MIHSLFLVLTGFRKYCRVEGNSMSPTLCQGDLVIYRPIRRKNFPIQEGCMVVVRHPIDTTTLIVKRVFRSNSIGIEVRGDNEVESTDSRKFGLINNKNIQGIVEEIIPSTFNTK